MQLSATERTIRLSKTGATSVHVTLLGLPPTVPAGTYHLVSLLEDSSGRTSAEAASSAFVVAAPSADLAATSLAAPASILVGKKVGATLVVKNDGTIPAIGPLLIVLYSSLTGVIDQNAVELKSVTRRINLRPRQSVRIPLRKILTAQIKGKFYLVANIDPANVFNDVALANNTIASNAIVVS